MQYFRNFFSIHHDSILSLFLSMRSLPFQFNPRPTTVENLFYFDYDYMCMFGLNLEREKKMHVSETRTERHLVKLFYILVID